MQCTSCGFENPDGFRFCGSCGSPLAAAPPAPGRVFPHDAPAAADGERRQLTVMFCDLAGSTSLSASMDPEEWREVVRGYQAACAEAIEENDGYIAQYLGDGVLAYFGYPRATEREAGRAVRAGLAVVRGVERMEAERKIGLAVRVGIHTGVVVIGEIGAGRRREQLALGDTPNLAARLQSLAEPDTVLVSGDTQRLVWDEFEYEALGLKELAGIPAPVQVCRIVGERAGGLAASRRHLQGDPTIVGRELELAFLHGRWERAREGSGQVVLVSGDAGMGKSCLMHAFACAIEDEAVVLETRCLPYYRSTAYQPVVDLLQAALGCAVGETAERKLSCLELLLERQGLSREELTPLFARVLSLPYDEAAPADGRTPAQRKDRTRRALLDLLLTAARDRPLLLCVEDLHWADPSTLELLALLAREIPGQRVLALLTHRPDFLPPWGHPAHQSQLSLSRLPQTEVEAVIARLCAGKPLPPEVHAQIVARTDGVPLFVEELTRTVLESGLLRERDGRYELVGGALPPLAIPATLHDSLEARLDRLATTKELAQLGSVLGREFSYRLMQAVSDVPEGDLREALAQLVSAELLNQRGVPPNAVYTFRHALIQEAAYQSLLKGVRQTWHQRAAVALEERFPDDAAAHPERVAQHYTAAGLGRQAVDAWIRAGRRALERSAHAEAAAHLRQGVEVLETLPAGPERDAWELSLLLPLGPALTAMLGHAADEVRHTYLRALELSRALGVVADHLEIMGGLFASYFVRSEMAAAFELATEMLRAAEEAEEGEGGSLWEGPAHVAVGIALLKAGALEDSRAHLERGVALYDPERHFPLALAMGQDFGVVGLSYSSFAHFALGEAGEALRRVRRAAELARELEHPHSLAFALTFLASVHYFRREAREALSVAEEMERLAERGGFRHWSLDAPPMRAWALAALGHAEEALEEAERIDADALVRTMGVGPGMHRVRMVAEAFLQAGYPDRAESLLAGLLRLVETDTPDVWWLSEVYRSHAIALARLGRAAEARARVEDAVARARAAGTPIFLLRALADLARFDGVVDVERRTALEEVLAALAGAGDLKEIAEARALLETRAGTGTGPGPGPEPVLVVA